MTEDVVCDKAKRAEPCDRSVVGMASCECGKVYVRCRRHGGEEGARRSVHSHRAVYYPGCLRTRELAQAESAAPEPPPAPAALELVSERRWTTPALLLPGDPYRYLFAWRWASGPLGLFVGLNPSKATVLQNDLTVMKWRGFASRFGWGGYLAANPFALRATDPVDLVDSWEAGIDIVGPKNDAAIADALEECDEVVACWGRPPSSSLFARVARVHHQLELSGKPLTCFGLTRDGHPKHPSRIGYATGRVAFG